MPTFWRRTDALMTSSDHSTLSRHPSSAQRTSVAASRRSAPSWRALPMLTALFSSNLRSAAPFTPDGTDGASSYATCHSTPPRERANALPSSLGRARAQNQAGGVGQPTPPISCAARRRHRNQPASLVLRAGGAPSGTARPRRAARRTTSTRNHVIDVKLAMKATLMAQSSFVRHFINLSRRYYINAAPLSLSRV